MVVDLKPDDHQSYYNSSHDYLLPGDAVFKKKEVPLEKKKFHISKLLEVFHWIDPKLEINRGMLLIKRQLQHLRGENWTWSEKENNILALDSSKGLFQIWWFEWGHKELRISNMEETDVQQQHHILHTISHSNWTHRPQSTTSNTASLVEKKRWNEC